MVWLNSPGGDVVAAAQIYNMLAAYPGQVTVNIDGVAASCSVGDRDGCPCGGDVAGVDVDDS